MHLYQAGIPLSYIKDFLGHASMNTTRISLLILDEWLLMPLSFQEARDLLEIVEARHKRASTIFASQFAPQGWHGKIGGETLADAI